MKRIPCPADIWVSLTDDGALLVNLDHKFGNKATQEPKCRTPKRNRASPYTVFYSLGVLIFVYVGFMSSWFNRLSPEHNSAVKVNQQKQTLLQNSVFHTDNASHVYNWRRDHFLTMRPSLCTPFTCSKQLDGSMTYSVDRADSAPVMFRIECDETAENFGAVEIAVQGEINGSFSIGYSHWVNSACGHGGWASTHLSSLVQGDRYAVRMGTHNSTYTIFYIPVTHFLNRPNARMHGIRLLGFKVRPAVVRFQYVKLTNNKPPPDWSDPGAKPASSVALYCRRPGVIAICIDDGNDLYMERTLDRLKEASIPATFFLVGRHLLKSAARRAFVRRAIAEGHSIQHHSWNHDDMSELSAADIAIDLDRTIVSAREAFGVNMSYFRPPRGRYDAALLHALALRNMTNVMWTFSLSDYGNATNTTIWARFSDAMNEYNHRKKGLIGVQHFSIRDSVDLIPRMAVEARHRGWRFVSLDECLQ